MCPLCSELGTAVWYVHVHHLGSFHNVYMYVGVCIWKSSHLSHLSIFFSHLMQEDEQPLGAGVYDTPTFSKPTLVKQVMDMPTYSDVFQAKVNTTR